MVPAGHSILQVFVGVPRVEAAGDSHTWEGLSRRSTDKAWLTNSPMPQGSKSYC